MAAGLHIQKQESACTWCVASRNAHTLCAHALGQELLVPRGMSWPQYVIRVWD